MYRNRKTACIITAGGSGQRMAAPYPKQFIRIGDRTILEKTVEVFDEIAEIDMMIVTTPEAELENTDELLGGYYLYVIPGGKERQDSVYNAIKLLVKSGFPDDGILMIHDGVRPFVTNEIVRNVLEEAAEKDAAICAVPVKDTVRHAGDGTLDRSALYSVQTPQAFRFSLVREAYEKAFAEDFYGTDDAGLVERLGVKPSIVEGSYENIKITTREDLKGLVPDMAGEDEPGVQPLPRIGTGFDVHAFAPDRKLILGGVEIPYELGLAGHSDADVLVHAVMDAMLGAAALGDIGQHFPDTDPDYKGANSLTMLKVVNTLLAEKGFMVGNIDATVICQKPKLAPFIPEMRKRIAAAIGKDISAVSVKATTTEKLGFTGRGEGIAAEAVCIITRL